jgi:uncharacterized protein (TIGR02145 family)
MIAGLTPKTTYYVRSYATNSAGTGYGPEIFFTTADSVDITPSVVSDADGNTYGVVSIGSQVWMDENLKTTKYNDGTDIPFIIDSLGWMSDQGGAYTWFRNNMSYKQQYGALYNWYAVNTDKLCPVDWHVPTEDEWIELENHLIASGFNYDGSSDGDWETNNKIAKAMSDIITWQHADEEGAPGNEGLANVRNASGFSALAGGLKDFYGSFGFFLQDGSWHPYEGIEGAWWSQSEIVEGAISVWWHEISTYQPNVLRSHNDKYFGLSVRCVMD